MDAPKKKKDGFSIKYKIWTEVNFKRGFNTKEP